jgi:hypothetical protein
MGIGIKITFDILYQLLGKKAGVNTVAFPTTDAISDG